MQSVTYIVAPVVTLVILRLRTDIILIMRHIVYYKKWLIGGLDSICLCSRSWSGGEDHKRWLLIILKYLL